MRDNLLNTRKLSVLMAVYNCESYIERAVNGILQQTFSDFELIVINDASQDDTFDILRSYRDPRLILIHNESNMGQTRSLIRGMEFCSAEIIARHDGDDYSFSDRFLVQWQFLETNPKIGLVGSAYQIVNEANLCLEEIKPPTDSERIYRHLIDKGNCFCHGSVMFRRSCYMAAGGYRPEFRITQDYDLWLRMSEHCPLSNLEKTLYQFRFAESTVSRQKPTIQLAYRRMAQELAHQRRDSGSENPIPEDVLAAYPPSHFRLYRNARRAAYLYYVSEQKKQAEDSIIQAWEIQQSANIDVERWDQWGLATARTITNLNNHSDSGESFLFWLASIPQLKLSAKKMIGAYYADQAYQANRQHNNSKTRKFVWRAIRSDFFLLVDRGFLKFAIVAIW